MDVIVEDRIPIRHSLLKQMNELHLLSLMDVPAGLSSAIDRFRETHLQDLVREYESGVSTIDGFLCVVGRKAKAS